MATVSQYNKQTGLYDIYRMGEGASPEKVSTTTKEQADLMTSGLASVPLSSPPIIASNQGKKTVEKAYEWLGGLTAQQYAESVNKVEKQNAETKKQPEPETITLTNTEDGRELSFSGGINNEQVQNLINTGQWTATGGTVPQGVDVSGKKTETDTTVQSYTDSADKFKEDLTSLQKRRNSIYDRELENVKAIIESRKRAYEDIYKRTGAQLQQIGLSRDIARYAPDQFRGILQANEVALQGKLSELDAEQESLILKAEQARLSEDYTSLVAAQNAFEKAQDKAFSAASELAKTAAENNKKVQERQREIEIGSTINKLIASGSSNADIFTALADVATPKEIKDALDAMSFSGNGDTIKNEFDQFQFFKKNNELPDSITGLGSESEQFAAYQNMLKGKTAGGTSSANVVIGVGATTIAKEIEIRARLFSKLMNILNKGQVSDSDYTRISETIALLRGAGYGEQQIMDDLSGFAIGIQTPFNNSFRDLIVQNTEDLDKQSQTMGKVSLLLNNENYKGAMQTVENLGFDRAKDILGTGNDGAYMSTGTAKVYLDRIMRIRALFKEGGVGIISGNFNQLLGKLKGQRAAEIKAELAQLYTTFRKENLGSAVTPSEAAFLEPLFSQINDRYSNFGTKIDVFERGVLDRANATRRQVGLPEADIKQFVDDNARLNLYASQSENPFSESLGVGEGSIVDEQGNFIIPNGK